MLQNQRAVFVLRLSNIDVEALDIELLMYYIFKVGPTVANVTRYFSHRDIFFYLDTRSRHIF